MLLRYIDWFLPGFDGERRFGPRITALSLSAGLLVKIFLFIWGNEDTLRSALINIVALAMLKRGIINGRNFCHIFTALALITLRMRHVQIIELFPDMNPFSLYMDMPSGLGS
jgi:hypothetical protein